MNDKSTTKSLNLQTKSRQEKKVESKPTTPLAPRRSLVDEECLSPIQIRCTQDGGDDELDVVWDWNSPNSRMKKSGIKQRKRPFNNVSPHIPRKLQPKNNLLPKFSSLKAELEKLCNFEDEIPPEEDDNLIISFIEEDFTIEQEKLHAEVKEEANIIAEQLEISDLFGDDSFDEEMVKCSQQIEREFIEPAVPPTKTIEILLNNHPNPNIADDSFDAILEEFTDEDMIKLSQETNEIQIKHMKTNQHTPPNKSRTIYRTHSTPVDRLEISKQKTSVPNSLPRTKSAENCSLTNPTFTCSPEEIEKKRLEAKAKLEMKRTQNEIEKKRLEALERLKRNRLTRNKTNSH